MSSRRSVGDVVWKAQGAGFVGQCGWVVIVDSGEIAGDEEPCELCDDDECIVWATVWPLRGNTKEEAQAALVREDYLDGMACHVSECQMLDQMEAEA